ncbi:putative E3 ubiquitin-protein ligase BRE1-like 1-like [Capsicum annuum]|nr:protein GrpE [Capsicum annuum]KAF3629048.1 putative E3 ubiquitin-protein ligase BRE1-like 1-like [Capsicum annuum]KAF3647164.1 putative E3 ubiquitin-protein ligase BRE1-like 1-like [Capsicum annuum]
MAGSAPPLSHTFYTLRFPSSSSSSSSCKVPRTSIHPFGHHNFCLNYNQCESTKIALFSRWNPIINNHNNRRSSAKTSVQASDDEDSPSKLEISNDAADEEYSYRLKSLMQVYKEAVLVGDVKAVSEIEALVIASVETERNDLAQKVSALSADISSGKEKYMRLQADFDNYRKRSENERLKIRTNAQGEIIESLLPMVDNFERAKRQLKLETEMEKKIDASYQGIYKQFVEIMRSLRVAVVPTVGKPFDPALHEAIAREESQEFSEGIVIEEFRRGFLLGDCLLRPAMVKVSSGPGKRVPAQKSPAATVVGVDES